jgi:hypothetical protein
MTLIIRPNLSTTILVNEVPASIAVLATDTYWPAARTANLVIAVPADAPEGSFVCITVADDETISARILYPGEVKVFGPLEREVLAGLFLCAPDVDEADEFDVIVSIDEVIAGG